MSSRGEWSSPKSGKMNGKGEGDAAKETVNNIHKFRNSQRNHKADEGKVVMFTNKQE